MLTPARIASAAKTTTKLFSRLVSRRTTGFAPSTRQLLPPGGSYTHYRGKVRSCEGDWLFIILQAGAEAPRASRSWRRST